MNRIPFFAAEDDLNNVLSMFENEKSLIYAKVDNYAIDYAVLCSTFADLPHLGTASADEAIYCESYLISENQSPLFRRIKLNDGREVFALDQLLNPGSVVLTPGGIRLANVVIAGSMSTASDSRAAQHLMRSFHTAIRKCFHKIQAYYVGPRAEVLLDAGSRLTEAIQAPRTFDLARA